MFRRILLLLMLQLGNSWFTKTNIPKPLWGKKLMVNGPRETNKYFSSFDGIGHITSIVFKPNETVISEVIIPDQKNEVHIPLSDFVQRDYFKLLSKLPFLLFKKKQVQSGTRNTAVVHFNDQYYAVEESCRPIKLKYNDDDELCYVGKSQSISRMSVHMPNNYTMFSYRFPEITPLKLNNTINVPWHPTKYPFLVHDCKTTEDGNNYIFPIMSTGVGRLSDYFKKIIDIPFDDQNNKAGWLVYNRKEHKCVQIMMDEYADIFHIADVKHLYRNVHKIYTSFVYDFPAWLTKGGTIDIRLKEVIVDLDKNAIIKINDTKLKMDFLHKIGDELIGSCLGDEPAVLKYNMKTRQHKKIMLPGKTVREVIPFDNYLLYFSHGFDKSYLYIADSDSGECVSKINIPHRIPGFHTTLFD